MKAISYRRVSTDEQAASGFSLPSQLREIEAYALRNGLELIADYYDDYTGSSLQRPGLDAARDCLKSGQAKAVIALDSDRVTRDPIHYILLRDEFKTGGVELHYAKRGRVDLDDFGQSLVEDFYGRFNHQWKAKLLEATKRGRREMARNGHVVTHGHSVYGYDEAEIDGLNSLVIADEQASVVLMIYRWYVYGEAPDFEPMSIETIAKELTRLGIPTPTGRYAKWQRSSVAKILNNETYNGRWYYAKISDDPSICVEVPVIIDDNLFGLAQKRRRENKKNLRRKTKYDYLLAGRLYCKHCGGKCHGATRISPNGFHCTSYRCSVAYNRRAHRKTCEFGKHFNGAKVEATAWDWTVSLLTDEKKRRDGFRRYQEQQAAQAGPLQAELNRVEKLLTENRTKLSRLLDLYLDGGLDKETYVSRKAGLEETISGLESQQHKLCEKLQTVTLTEDRIRTIEEFAEKVSAKLEAMDQSENTFEIKRQILNLLDVAGELAIEEGQPVIYLSCILDDDRRLLSSSSSTGGQQQYGLRLIERIVLS